MDITNKTVLITGGAQGMGKATALYLQERGAKVAIIDIHAKERESRDYLYIKADVTNETEIKQALHRIKSILGTVQICVNCAGMLHARRMVNKEGPMPLLEFEKVIKINLLGTFNVMRLVVEQMQTLPPFINESRGIIINTASIAGYEGQIGQTAYSAAKGGVIALTLPAARELASSSIRVMTIAPGLVDTPMLSQLNEAEKTTLTAHIPFPKRLARAEEFAQLVAHIIENEMLNGSVIRLDGALRMQAR